MLEEEARWTQEVEEMQSSSPSPKFLKEVHHIRGSSMLEQSQDFVKLSGIQVRALREHHRPWLS